MAKVGSRLVLIATSVSLAFVVVHFYSSSIANRRDASVTGSEPRSEQFESAGTPEDQVGLEVSLAHHRHDKLQLRSVDCPAGTPCVYGEEVDLRIIVLTHDRRDSVMKLLESLQKLELDGDRAVLEIWIDQKIDGKVDAATLEAVVGFCWDLGPTRVHIQTSHVGIIGQWIDTWRPKKAPPFEKNPSNVEKIHFDARDYREIALILEDDMSLSPQAYRWLRAAHRKYNGRKDFAGVTLQSDEVLAHNTGQPMSGPKNESAYMYTCIGTWGFAPAQKLWAEFQDWYHMIRSWPNSTSFHPYVEGALPTQWYKDFEVQGTQDTMWEMWFIYYADLKKAFTVINNLPTMNGDKNSCLSINRREVGLHYPQKGPEDLCKFLESWDQRYVEALPKEPLKYDWNGQVTAG